MSIFYLEIENQFYALDSTESVQKSLKGSLSNSKVEDGAFSSDNYVTNPITFSFSGIITDIKTTDTSLFKDPKVYLDQINRAFNLKLPIKIYYSDIQLPSDNCYFTSFSHTQDSTFGRNQSHNSFQVNFTLQEVRYGRGARITSRPSEALSRSLQKKTEKEATTKEPSKNLNDTIVAAQKNISEGRQLREKGTSGN